MTRASWKKAVESTKFFVTLLESYGVPEEELVPLAAGKTLYEIVLLHPLEDGNKRFSVVYLATLMVNGWELKAEGVFLEMLFDVVVRLTKNPKDWGEVEEAFKELDKAIRSYSKTISVLDS